MIYTTLLTATLLLGVVQGIEDGVDILPIPTPTTTTTTTPTTKESTDNVVWKAETALRESLLKNYDKTALPRMNMTVTIIDISIQNFKVYEFMHTMQVYVRLSLLWDDPRLIWDLQSNPNVGFLGMDPESIWTPDLAIYNSETQSHVPRSSLPMLVYPTGGTILYSSPYTLEFTCIMDLTYWPHDTHTCTMKLGSWVHQGHILDMFLKNNTVEIDIPTQTKSGGKTLSAVEWSIVKTAVSREKAIYPCCREPLVSILMTLVVKRNAPVYSWTVKLPIACLSIITLILFLLPPAAGEKLVFGGLCLLMNMMYIDYTSRIIPHAPTHTPLIIRLVSQQVMLITVSLVVSTLVLRLSRDPHSFGLPSKLKRIIVTVSYPLCLKSYRDLVPYSNLTLEFHSKSDELDLEDGSFKDHRRRLTPEGREWLFLAAVIDRLAFIFYSATCIISFIRFSSVL